MYKTEYLHRFGYWYFILGARLGFRASTFGFEKANTRITYFLLL